MYKKISRPCVPVRLDSSRPGAPMRLGTIELGVTGRELCTSILWSGSPDNPVSTVHTHREYFCLCARYRVGTSKPVYVESELGENCHVWACLFLFLAGAAEALLLRTARCDDGHCLRQEKGEVKLLDWPCR